MATRRGAPRWWGLQLLVWALGTGATWSAHAETKAETKAAATTTAAPAVSTGDDKTLAEARLHFENGLSLLQASPPNYQDAHQQFLLAYEKSGKRWSVLGNLALCALNLERDGEALAYYEAYLEQGGTEIDPDERAAIEREVLLIKGNMATVDLTSSEPGTRVSVRREGSSAPAQLYSVGADGAKLGLRAGQLQITATAGDKTETWSVVLSAGDAKSHAFAFAPPPAAATTSASTPATPQPEPDRGPSPVRTAGFITGGVGVAALIGGVVTGIMTTQKDSDARAQCIGDICPEAAEADFQAAADMALVTNILLIGGGVLTATGVTLVIVGGKKPSRETARQVFIEPHVSPFFAGFSAHGTF